MVFILVFTNRIQILVWVWEIFCCPPLRKTKVKVEPKIKTSDHLSVKFWSTRPGGAVLSPLGERGEVFMKFGWNFLYWVWEIFCCPFLLQKWKVKVETKTKSEFHFGFHFRFGEICRMIYRSQKIFPGPSLWSGPFYAFFLYLVWGIFCCPFVHFGLRNRY